MSRDRTYTDAQLLQAIDSSSSWRAVLRHLGLNATSSAAIRSVRLRADHIGADYDHFRGKRRWTDHELERAIISSKEWAQVAEVLGCDDRGIVPLLKGHAARMGLNVAHLAPPVAEPMNEQLQPSLANLHRAGSLLAASWLTMSGFEVSWPLEPCRYDLLALNGPFTQRVQVKTTTAKAGSSWKVYLSTSHGGRQVYTPDEVDSFFIIDGALSYYLIPLPVVGGLQALHLKSYQQYRLPSVHIGVALTSQG